MSTLSALRTSRAAATAFVAVGLFWGSFAAQVPVIKARIGADDVTFGMLLLGTAIGLLSTMLLAPSFDQRFGGRALPFSCLGFAVVALLPGLVASLPMFFVVMVLAGMASGLTDVIMNARVSELEAATEKPLMNANHGMFSVAYAVAALLTGFAREAGFGPLVVFTVVAITIAVLSKLTHMKPAVASQMSGASRFPVGVVALGGSVVLIAFMAEAVVEQWSALHIERTLSGSATEGALGPATLGFMMAVGRFSGQAVSERLNAISVIVWATLMAVSGAVLAALATTSVTAYFGFGLLGLGVSVIGPLGLAIVGRMVPPHERTKAISRTAVIGFMGFFIAPALVGLTSQTFGLRIAFAATGGVTLIIVPLIFALKRRGA
ncbi:MAG: MFS transporter [Litoreibacter sp.]